jgi:anti-sigma-K factor RskA
VTDQERLELMLEYVAGTLDAPQTERVRRALTSGDPTWAASLAEAEATLAAYAAAIEPMSPPPAVKSALLQRIATTRTSERAPVTDEYKSGRRFAQAFAAVAAIIFVAVLVNMWTIRRINSATDQVRAEYKKELSDRDANILVLKSLVERDTRVREALLSRNLKVVDLGSDKTKAIGRLLIDVDKSKWLVFTVALPPLPADKTYELWFITPDGRKVAAGTFNVDLTGNGMISVPLPKDIGPVAVAAITDEPAGGVPAPTGSVQLVGKLQ